MDLALYLRVLWRFKFIFAAGFFVAVLLAFFAVEKVSFAGGSIKTTPRKTQTWKSDAFLEITGPGFPVGRSTPAYTRGNQKTGKPSVDLSDPQRLSYLTTVYANLATGDAVVRGLGMDPTRPTQTGTLTVAAVPGPAYSNPAILNILDFTGTGPTKARAMGLANGGAKAFQTWLGNNQEANGITWDSRTFARLYKNAGPPVLISHSGKTLPVIVFLTLMGATFGLCLALENLRPRPTDAAAGKAVDRDDVDKLRVEPTAESGRHGAVQARRSSAGRSGRSGR